MRRAKLNGMFAVIASALLVTFPRLAGAQAEVNSLQKLDDPRLAQIIQAEMYQKGIPAMAVGVARLDGTLWLHSWVGSAEADQSAKPTSQRFHIGTLSSLFTALSVMQLAATGQIDLDDPVNKYLPGFRPQLACAGKAIRVRDLLEHRSGLVREAPVGAYWQTAPAALDQIVASLNSTRLSFCPGTTKKYSNADAAVAARVIEVASGLSYQTYLQQHIFAPLGLHDTSIGMDGRTRTVQAVIQSIDWERIPVTVSGGANAPARGIATTIGDLSIFAQALLGNMRGLTGGRLTSAIGCANPERMDYACLGFKPTVVKGRRLFDWQGSTYGHTALLRIIPEERLAIVALSASHQAPASLKAADLVSDVLFDPADSTLADGLTSSAPKSSGYQTGYYRNSAGLSANIREVEGKLWMESPEISGELRRLKGHWVVDDATTFYRNIELDGDRLRIGKTVFTRQALRMPADLPPFIASVLGEYGWLHDYIRIYERDGDLYARTDWGRQDKLTNTGLDEWAFVQPNSDFAGERLRFIRSPAGEVTSLNLSGSIFPRREFGREAGENLKRMVQVAADLVGEASRSQPPAGLMKAERASDLVSLKGAASNIKLEINYATSDNFMGMPVYYRADAYLQRPAAQAVVRVAARLRPMGYGLVVHDAYRPWAVSKLFWDAMPADGKAFAADPAEGSRHNRGSAVDLSLYDLRSGKTVSMPGDYDEISSRSFSIYLGGSSRARWLRDTLREAMQAEGLNVILNEWWHFDHVDWAKYPVANVSFEKLEQKQPK